MLPQVTFIPCLMKQKVCECSLRQSKSTERETVVLSPKAQLLPTTCNSAMWTPAGTSLVSASPAWSTGASAALCATPRIPKEPQHCWQLTAPQAPQRQPHHARCSCPAHLQQELVPTLLRTSHFSRWLSGATKEPSEGGAKQKRGFKQELRESICADIHQCHSLAAKAIFINHVSKLATNLYKETDGLVVAVCHH